MATSTITVQSAADGTVSVAAGLAGDVVLPASDDTDGLGAADRVSRDGVGKGTRSRRPSRRPLGFSAQLWLALVAQALLTLAITGLLIHQATGRQLRDFGRTDLQQTAQRVAALAGSVYGAENRWSPRRLEELLRPERVEDHAIVIVDPAQRPIIGDPERLPPDTRSAGVVVRGRRVGTVIAAHSRGGYLEVGRGGSRRHLGPQLTDEVDAQLLQSALLAGALAMLFGLCFAIRVTAPLQRVTAAARQVAQGRLETRASGGGGSREIQELGETLDRLAAALRREDEQRRATAADVAHELRNALCGVVGRLEALEDGYVDDERAALERATRDARRMNRLIGDVRLLAEAQRPSLLVAKRPVELDEIATDRVAAFADRFAYRGIALHTQIAPARVEGDPERLGQILDNLLSNALRYTDPGGAVTLRIEADGEQAIAQVTDSGIGIAPEHVGRIFDRFWRAPGARTRVAEGSGVGLALVHDLVLAHNGTIDVQSRPGRGSTFRVVLPTTPATDAARTANAAPEPVQGGVRSAAGDAARTTVARLTTDGRPEPSMCIRPSTRSSTAARARSAAALPHRKSGRDRTLDPGRST
jgi:two-component system sensor histidine kinase BaeS